jgi:hypothetical protein
VPKKSKQIIFYTILCMIFSLNNVLVVGADGSTIENQIVVLFDEGHGQFFDHSLYSQAISDLIINKSMKVVFNRGILNKTSFEGVDIFVSTNPQESYSYAETFRINKFITQGKAMFLIADPLDEDNENINGRGHILNDLLDQLEYSHLLGKFWANTREIDSYFPGDVVHNEFDSEGISEYLQIELNSSDHKILSIDKNITSIVTYSCSIETANEEVIIAPPEAYAKTVFGEISSGSSNIILFGSPGDELEIGARILLGGSSFMFSDLYEDALNSTWYESKNNSLLWLNIFDWLAEVSPETPPPYTISEQFLITTLGLLAGIAILFSLGGSLFFLVGSGRKILIVKSGEENVAKPKPQISVDKDGKPSSVKPSPPSKESRRDRRLRQIQKNHRGKKK